MKAGQVSDLLLVQAVESVDEEGEILSFAERRQANEALEGESAGSLLEAESARAALLIPHIQSRANWLWETTQSFVSLPWIFGLGCALFALAAGAGVQALGVGRTFHVLSAPFLGLLLWNGVSLGFLLLGPWLWSRWFQRKPSSVQMGLRWQPGDTSWGRSILAVVLWFQKKWSLLHQPESKELVHLVSLRALRIYWQDWLQQGGKLLQLQCARILHLSMMLFCGSMLLVAYLQGLTKAYMATRESTFLTENQIEWLLRILFAPSQWLLGPLPSSKATVMGLMGPAGPWIHHYAVTLVIFVILPRLLLFIGTWIQCARLSEYLPVSLDMVSQVPTLNVALASHTNVGKTSLARTLLRRDVGEVRDAEHVTRRRAGYFLVNTEQGRLRLWDTPGFGNAQALLRNLRGRQGWAWLRTLQDPKLRFDREAALSLQEEADLILYLIPAYGEAQVESMLREEWAVLREIGRPVICVLNRLEGAEASEEERLLQEWRKFFAHEPLCCEVISLDAFSRSWQDEQWLFGAIERAVVPEKKQLAAQLREAWDMQNQQRHQAVGHALAGLLKKLRQDREVEGQNSKESVYRLQSRAQREIVAGQNQLLATMELRGEICDRMVAESETFFRTVMAKGQERTWGAILGGAISGLASGIMADIMAGGMTFLGGAAVGAILGALGGAGVAEGYRRIGKKGEGTLEWDERFLKGVTLRMTALYLTASSFGRARGELSDEIFFSGRKVDKDFHLTPEQKRQVLFFQASERALQTHWPKLWSILEQQITRKIEIYDSNMNLDNICVLLLSDALEQLHTLRKRK